MLISLTAPPPSLSTAELTQLSSSTPSSFEGIPPLLRHFEREVEFFLDPPFEGVGAEGKGTMGSLWITEGSVEGSTALETPAVFFSALVDVSGSRVAALWQCHHIAAEDAAERARRRREKTVQEHGVETSLLT